MTAALHPPCDRALAQSAAPRATTAPHPNLILATTILASSLAFIDGSVVNVGLPAIAAGLAADGAGLAWVINGYLLPLSALLLLGGAAGDLFGRRRLLTLGTGLFALASLLCSLAPSLGWLLAGRVLQGVGAAMLMPNSITILGASFSGEARGRAIGSWAAVGAAAGAIGPLLGGWLVDGFGWRAMFWINLPIAAAALALALRYVPDERRPDHPGLDWPGALLATAGLAALTWGLTAASGQGWHGLPLAALAAGAATLALFVALERRRGEQAMLPLGLFAAPGFAGLNLLTLLLYGALGGLLVLVPYLLIQQQGYSATQAGAALLPLPLVIALTAPAMGRLAARVGARWPLTLGPVVVALGCLLAMRIGQDGGGIGRGGYWTTTLPAMLVIALGMAGAVAPLTAAVLGSVEPRHTGIASGFNSAVARTGGLVATALLGAILALQGPALLAAFRLAALLAAAAAVLAGLCAFLGLRTADPGGRNPP